MGHLQATETSERNKGSDKAPEQRFDSPRLEISNQDMLEGRQLFTPARSAGSEPTILDFGDTASLYGNKDATGSDKTVRIGSREYNPDDVLAGPLEDIRANAIRVGFPHFAKEDQYVDYAAAREAMHLAGLDKYKLPQDSIGAILRNEQRFYKFSDEAQDKEAQKTGTVLKDGKENDLASIGPAQMQLRNIRNLIAAKDEHGEPRYPFLQHMKDDPVRGALDKRNAPLLVGAYLENEIARRHLKPEDISIKSMAYIYNEDVHSFGNPKQFVACDDPVSLTAQRTIHPDLKDEHYPTAQVLAHSIHAQHVAESLAIIEKTNRQK